MKTPMSELERLRREAYERRMAERYERLSEAERESWERACRLTDKGETEAA